MEHSVLDRTSIRSSSDGLAMVRRFFRTRQNLRVLLYAALVLCDIVAIRMAFSIGSDVRGPFWMSPHGVEIGWLILPLHILAGLRGGAYSLESVRSRLESIAHASRAFIFATALICMLLVFEKAGLLVSRLAFGVSIMLSLVFIAVIRALFLTVFVGRDKTWMFGELLIVDDGSTPVGHVGEIVDAKRLGLAPDLHDPEQLAKLADLVVSFDRVVVSCSTEKRSAWAQMMKSFDLKGEVLLDDGSPLGAVGIDRFLGHDTVIVARGKMSLGNRMKKRMMDIVVSLAALVFLAPLFIVVAIAIKLDSKGPVFFAQPRVGRGNRLFRILKFRSMKADSSDLAGNRSTTKGDDRITAVGRIIRATSIDELPQLFNVLAGDMSIVGPRPHALGSLAGDKLFWEIDTTYWRRHTLKPGITGLAQVRGFRGATHRQTDLQNRLQADLEYISGWSLWRDIKILISTVRVVVHPQAY